MSTVATLKASLSKIAAPAQSAADDDSWITGASDEHLGTKQKFFDAAIKDAHEALVDGGKFDPELLKQAIQSKRKIEAEMDRRAEANAANEQRAKIEQQRTQPAAAPQTPAPTAATAAEDPLQKGFYLYSTTGSSYGQVDPDHHFKTLDEARKFLSDAYSEEIDDDRDVMYADGKGGRWIDLKMLALSDGKQTLNGRKVAAKKNDSIAALAAALLK